MMDSGRSAAERKLLCNCCRPTYDADAAERTVELARRDLDWDRLYETARWHHVRPLLAERLDSTAEFETISELPVPDRIRSKLRADRRTIAQRNLLASDQLRTVAERLEEVGVRVLPFKGPAIAADVYGDVSRREFSDIDLLVPRDDVPSAMDVLESCGYRWEYDAPRLDDGAVQGGPFTPPLAREYRTVHETNGTMIELRWQVGESTNPFPIGFERLWRDSTETTVQGTEIRVLDPINRLLVLTYHGTKHYWQRLKWLCDVAWVIERREIDWDELLARSRRNRTERRLLLGVALARQLFDVAIPATVADRIGSDDDLSILVGQTLERLAEHPAPSIGYWDLKRYVGRSSDSALGTVETVGRALLEPKMHEYESYPLPARYHALYYLLRPVRVVSDSLSRGGR